MRVFLKPHLRGMAPKVRKWYSTVLCRLRFGVHAPRRLDCPAYPLARLRIAERDANIIGRSAIRIVVRLGVGILAVVLSCLLLATSSVAYNKNLTPDDIRAAIDYGKSRRGKDIVDRDSPYFVGLDLYNFVILST